MIAGVVQHLWQSSVFVTVAALLAMWLRGHQAKVRYAVWLAASVKWLVPFPVLQDLGAKLGCPVAHEGTANVVVQRLGQAFTLNWSGPLKVGGGAVASSDGGIGGLLAALWMAGSVAMLFRWIQRWRQTDAVVRQATPLTVQEGIRVARSRALYEPGVFGIWRPVIVLPEGIAQRLSVAELQGVIAHEVCHVQRHDNLTTAIHMVVECLFWFHPLVWWLGARLLDERERACDESVLALGAEPQLYAESILKVCEFWLESPLACVAGVTGSDLNKRVERIMNNRIGKKLVVWKKALLAGLGAAAVLGPVAIGVMNAPAGRAQEAESISGSWTGKATMTRAIDGQARPGPILLSLQQRGTTLTGSVQGDKFETPISIGRIEGDRVHLELGVDSIKLDLRLTDGHLVGGGTGSKGGALIGSLKVDLTRAPPVTLDQIGGTWVGSFTLHNANGPMKPTAILQLNQDGKTITGSIGMNKEHMIPIRKGSVDGVHVRLEIDSPENQFQGAFDLGVSAAGRLLGEFTGTDHGNPMSARLEASKVEN